MKRIAMRLGASALVMVAALSLLLAPPAHAEPQSQADCPAGTIFVGGAAGDTGNLAQPNRSPNQCITPKANNTPTTTITCADGSTRSGVTPNLTADQQKLVCSGSGITDYSSTPGFTGNCNNGGVHVSVTVDKNGNNCVGGGGVNPIYAYLKGIIRFLSGLFGIVAVLMVIFSGFQYMTSRGNPENIRKAKLRLGNVVLSIILFAMMFGILNYLIPGGVL